MLYGCLYESLLSLHRPSLVRHNSQPLSFSLFPSLPGCGSFGLSHPSPLWFHFSVFRPPFLFISLASLFHFLFHFNSRSLFFSLPSSLSLTLPPFLSSLLPLNIYDSLSLSPLLISTLLSNSPSVSSLLPSSLTLSLPHLPFFFSLAFSFFTSGLSLPIYLSFSLDSFVLSVFLCLSPLLSFS